MGASSEDLRHDGGGDIGGRVHVREVGVHVFGQHEQPNKEGPNWQPEQLGRPQRIQICVDAILKTDLVKLVIVCSKSNNFCLASVKIGSKLKKVFVEGLTFVDFLTFCWYLLRYCQNWTEFIKISF